MLTKNIILLILALCCLLPLHAAESATAVLDKAAAKIRASKSLSASYTITADGQSNSGTLTIRATASRLSLRRSHRGTTDAHSGPIRPM